MSCFEDWSSMLARMRATRECCTIEYEDNDQEDLSPKDCTRTCGTRGLYTSRPGPAS